MWKKFKTFVKKEIEEFKANQEEKKMIANVHMT